MAFLFTYQLCDDIQRLHRNNYYGSQFTWHIWSGICNDSECFKGDSKSIYNSYFETFSWKKSGETEKNPRSRKKKNWRENYFFHNFSSRRDFLNKVWPRETSLSTHSLRYEKIETKTSECISTSTGEKTAIIFERVAGFWYRNIGRKGESQLSILASKFQRPQTTIKWAWFHFYEDDCHLEIFK